MTEVGRPGLLYLDSSAIVKLVAREPESAVLYEWVVEGRDAVTSALALVEVERAVRRIGGGETLLDRARSVLELIALIKIDDAILARAAHLEPAGLHSMDAIHLATALSVQEHLEAFLVYDQRLRAAASELGLEVETPG